MFPPVSWLSAPGQFASEIYSEFGVVQPNKSTSALERQYTTQDSSFVSVGDCRIHYCECGDPSDQTVLLLHGTYASLHTWEPWQDRLSDRFHLVSLDLPGFGLTGPREEGEHTLEYLVQTVEAFCDTLGLQEVAIAGNSLGGGIAWRLTVDRPELVSKLVLIDAGGATLLVQIAETLSSYGYGLVPQYFTPRFAIRLIVLDAYGDTTKVTADLVRRYHDLLLRPGNRQAVVELANTYARDHPVGEIDDMTERFVPALPSKYDPSPEIVDQYDITEVAVPTLFQWGSEDRWLPVSFGRELAANIDGSRFTVYDGVGHMPMEEEPDTTAADAAAFLGSG